jgi:hypothetical protein
MSYQKLFANLWEDYTRRNPHALAVFNLFEKKGEHVINDHVAFRTFNHPKVNVDALAKFFTQYGYVEKGTYEFPVKKLFAKHYEHADPEAPKVFISELKVEEFSKELQHIAKVCVEAIPSHLLNSEALLTSGAVWQPLRYKTYKELLSESEYAAWMYAFGFCANHFTVNANALKSFKEISEINDFLEANGFMLNKSGGAVKGTPQECLEQSSTLAGEIEVPFIEGAYKIPSCYYEFAKRYPMADGKLYTGFIAASADKIFESTDVNTHNR